MMKSCLYQKIDSQGRIQIPNILIKNQTTISPGKVAICLGENFIYLRSPENTKNCKIVDFRQMDQKNRIILPKSLSQQYVKFLVYLLNGEIRIEGIL